MPNIHPVSLARHGNKRWRRPSSYNFAAANSLVSLVTAELPKAVISMPIGLVEDRDGFSPVAIVGFEPGFNVFVSDNWKWLGQYIPAALRGYPFQLAKMEDGSQVLCVDEDNDLISEGASGDAFFAEDGRPSPALSAIFNFLAELEKNRQLTARACAVLKEQDLIIPWPITVEKDGGNQQISGLFQIDEARLNALSAEALKAVQAAGGLVIAYCQLLSKQHLQVLARLAQLQASARTQANSLSNIAPDGELNLEFFNKGGTFSFGSFT